MFAILLIKTSLYYVENIFVQYTSVLACIAFLTVFVFVPTTHPGILLDFRVPASPQLNPQTLTKVLLRVAQLLYPLVQSLYQELFGGFLDIPHLDSLFASLFVECDQRLVVVLLLLPTPLHHHPLHNQKSMRKC